MKIMDILVGIVEVTVTAADISQALSDMEKAGIFVYDTKIDDPLTVRLCVSRRDSFPLKELCDKKGYDLALISKNGLYWSLRKMLHRPVLIIGIILLFILTLWTPGRIFFVFVEGNQKISSNLILEQAANCGMEFGASRKMVRSEKMKNALLERMPQLQWVGVNTFGCVGVISVVERQQTEIKTEDDGVYSIVAVTDSVIREMTVTQGTPLCFVGDAVKEEQVLVSGYTDCGFCIRGVKAEGEICGETKRDITAIFPLNYQARGQILSSERKFSLIIGKKRINFQNNSGISGGECVRIYSEKYVTLPGGFRLPIAIVTEQFLTYATEPMLCESPESALQPFVTTYLQSQMIAGRILSSVEQISIVEEVCRLDGVYGCYEMIGILRPEESLPEYESS